MKRAFAVLSAIIFMMIIITMAVKLLSLSSEQESLIGTEYARAQARSLVEIAAQNALARWATGYRAFEAAGGSNGHKSPGTILVDKPRALVQEDFALRESILVTDPDDPTSIIDITIADPNKYHFEDLISSPVLVGKERRVIYYNIDGTIASSSDYHFAITIDRLLHRPGSGYSYLPDADFIGGFKDGLKFLGDQGAAYTCRQSSDYMLATDSATADFFICASTHGGKLDEVAPAGYCARYTFSN